VAQHAITLRISQIRDEAGNVVYDGQGPAPAGYGTLEAGPMPQTDAFGYYTGLYHSGPKLGKIQIEAIDEG
jgi:hypothetical protein